MSKYGHVPAHSSTHLCHISHQWEPETCAFALENLCCIEIDDGMKKTDVETHLGFAKPPSLHRRNESQTLGKTDGSLHVCCCRQSPERRNVVRDKKREREGYISNQEPFVLLLEVHGCLCWPAMKVHSIRLSGLWQTRRQECLDRWKWQVQLRLPS